MDLSNLIPSGGIPPTPQINWSPMQRAIFEACRNNNNNLSVEAVAGSGKTTTIVEAIEKCNGSNALFLAFSKDIAKELKKRVPDYCDARTFHSLGLKMLNKILAGNPRKEMNGRRDHDIIKINMSKQQYEDAGYDVVKVLAMAKNTGMGINEEMPDSGDFEHLIDEFELFLPEEHEAFCLAHLPQWYTRSCDITDGVFDFNDMVFQPLYHNMEFPSYDVVFADEAQDLNHIQHLTLAALSKAGARIIAVGDSYQAIYGFRGADHRSMSNLAHMFNAASLPLSVSYRCPETVVKIAKGFVPHIEARADAPQGTVEYLDKYPTLDTYENDSMVICRNNAPIFRLGMSLLKARLPCQLKTTHGKDLISFIKRLKVDTLHDFNVKLTRWYHKEYDKALDKDNKSRLAFVQERYDILKGFEEECDSPAHIIRCINDLLFSKRGPILCTIHKAKGLEANHVYLLRPDLIPSRFAVTDAQLQQEYNMEYVAVTRALDTLTYLPTERKT